MGVPGSEEKLKLIPIFESPQMYEELETRIREAFRVLIYEPIMKEFRLSSARLKNSSDKLLEAIRSGRVSFSRGTFTGRFNASITKELRTIGAIWDRKTLTYRLPKKELPADVRSAVAFSEAVFKEKLEQIDKRLSQILPEFFSDSIKIKDVFETNLWKTDKNIVRTLRAITIQPELSPWARAKIADEWTHNTQRSISDFTKKEIVKLRTDLQKSIMAGNRYESAIKSIQKSYAVTEKKARFIARQETKLLMAKFKETKYAEAGVYEYEWRCVVGSPNHPVRPSHKKLEGKIFRFDNPPVTTAPDEPARKNNPGEDYNCRCFAIPVVRKSKKTKSS